MTVIASFFLVVSVWLAVLLGPKLSAWMWGPGLLALGLAVLAAVPGGWRQRVRGVDGGLMALGAMVVVWFGWRAWASPVTECGLADLLLLAGVVGGAVVMRAMQGQVQAERVFLWGLAVLVLASAVVVAWQVREPDFMPGFVAPSQLPSGFIGHYNEGANLLIGASCLVAGGAMFGSYRQLERAIWGGIAVAGLLAVYFTRSRGGICGGAVGLGVFAALALIIGKRRGARWFAPGLVALPLIGFAVVGFLIKGWTDAQAVRNQAPGLDVMMDNAIRLHLIGIATSCIGLHPWQGGGSRSFSWECNRFWEADMYGPGTNRPEQVHNEFLQAATDYGLIGVGLLGMFIGALVVVVVIRSLFAEATSQAPNADSWRIGGVAGLAGILAQSNFSFVFHMLPGALLLGLCLGRAMHTGAAGKAAAAHAPAMVATGFGLACAALLVPMGWLGSRLTVIRWEDSYGKHRVLPRQARIAALTEAIQRWPLKEFYLARANIFQQQSAESSHGGYDKAAVNRALEDYQAAAVLNPFDPEPVVNRANLLGLLGEDAEAIEQFDRAISLQGGMEAGFKACYSKAAYLQVKADRLLATQQNGEALEVLMAARDTLVKASDFPSGAPLGLAARSLRIAIASRLGVMLSMAGRDQEAEAEFESAAMVWGGTGINYLHAWHLRNKAERIWKERNPAEALRLFLKARTLLAQAGPKPLPGDTADERAKLRQDLDQFIKFLQAAKIQPSVAPGK
jgi:O-antigen ligase/tetratricopeptide (TPR) repeat protein